jgi:hypothetical protein
MTKDKPLKASGLLGAANIFYSHDVCRGRRILEGQAAVASSFCQVLHK